MLKVLKALENKFKLYDRLNPQHNRRKLCIHKLQIGPLLACAIHLNNMNNGLDELITLLIDTT